MIKYNQHLLNTLFLIKKRPIMMLSHKSIYSLADFINGFAFGIEYYDKSKSDLLLKLNKKIIEKTNINDAGLYNNLLILCDNDEQKSFDLFFEELEAFLGENDIQISMID